MKRLAITILCLFMTSAALADVILYLYPSVVKENEGLTLGRIAMIDGTSGDRKTVSGIEVPAGMYGDGYVDRREIQAFLKSRIEGTITVIGSAVKINFLQRKNGPARPEGVVRGKTVKVIYHAGAIRIEVRGTAMGRGLPGETIAVRVNRQIIRAVVLDSERVKKQI